MLASSQHLDDSLPTQTLAPVETSSESISELKHWGRLIPLNPANAEFICTLRHNKNVYTIGRDSKCDFILSSDKLLCSNLHAKLHRVNFKIGDTSDHVVMLEDLSTNGTYIGDRLVGKNQKILLTSGAEISFGCKSSNGQINRFIFQASKDQNTTTETTHGIHALYDLGDVVGVGNFSTVKYAIHRVTGESVAVKIVDASRHQMFHVVTEALEREVAMLKSIQHPNIIKFCEVFQEGMVTYIVMELMTGGDLLSYILSKKKLTEESAAPLFHQMMSAVNHLHYKKITHRDLKPDNFLLKDPEYKVVKLGDFGLAKQTGGMTFCGTPAYSAPEMKNGAPFTPSADCWSMGVIFFFMVSGFLPWSGECGGQSVDWKIEKWPDMTKSAKNLISALLNIDPTLRFSMAQALKYIPSFRIGQEKEKKEDCFAMPSPISLKRQNTKENEKRNHPVSRTSTNNSTSLLSNSVKPLMKAWGMLRSHTSPQHAIILNKSQISIGRSPDCDVVVKDPRISTTHCIFYFEDGQAFLKDNSSNGTFVQENRIGRGKSYSLSDGDDIYFVEKDKRFPKWTFHTSARVHQNQGKKLISTKRKISIDEPLDKTVRISKIGPAPYWLRLSSLSPNYADVLVGKEINSLTIGRHPGCDICILNPMVSVKHAILSRCEDGTIKIEDSSMNGTIINQVVLKKREVILNSGDKIIVKPSFHADDEVIGFTMERQ